MKKFILFFMVSLPCWAGPFSDTCYKNARSTFGKSVARSIFDPRVSIFWEGIKAHKINQIRASIKTANTGKFTYMSKLMAKNVGLTNKEFLKALRANPKIICNKKNELNDIGNIWTFFEKYKLKPRIMARLKSIQGNCSPSAIINQLRKSGSYNPARFQATLTIKMKELAKGQNRRFGKEVKGFEKRVNWIYNMENNFSDPLLQAGKNYQYIIHGIRSTHSVGLHEWALKSANKYLNELTKTSLSIVNQDDTYPFTRGIGILVKADPKTIWASHMGNMASDHQSLKNLNKNYPIKTPGEIFKYRKFPKVTQNNEIVSLGGSEVIGYYLFQKPGSKKTMWYLYEPDKLEVLEKACIKNKLPVINIDLTGRGYL